MYIKSCKVILGVTLNHFVLFNEHFELVLFFVNESFFKEGFSMLMKKLSG